MDGYSLSEIMARLAKQIEEEDEEQDEKEAEDAPEGTNASVAGVTTTTDAVTLVVDDNNDVIETSRTDMNTDANQMISTLGNKERVLFVAQPDESRSSGSSTVANHNSDHHNFCGG